MSDGGNNGYWGDHYPVSCPPESAKSKDINPVYRLTLNDPPLEEDFQSHKEANKRYPPDKECEACAISVFADLDQIQKAKKKIVLFKNRGHVIQGQIVRESGVVSEPDHKSHSNWWVYNGTDVKKYFEDNS